MKKYLSFFIVLILIFSLAGCGSQKSEEELKAELKEEVKAEIKAEMEAEQENQEVETPETSSEEPAEEDNESVDNSENTAEEDVNGTEGDEIVTTYAYGDIDGIDVSGLNEVVFDASDIGDKSDDGELVDYKIAFFGNVYNVRINSSDYIYEDYGVEVASYENLKDTLLTIKAYDFLNNGFFVFFEDGRGIEHRYIISDEYASEKGKVELVSGFTALEKTPSSYSEFDMSDIINSLGMTTDEFENSPLMEYAKKEERDGMDDIFYSYIIEDLIKGVRIEFSTSESEKIIQTCSINKDDESYNSLSNDEKYSFLGVDFDMTFVRAQKNMKNDSALNVNLWENEPGKSISEIFINLIE